MTAKPDHRFACDAMMKGLARWLRAAGYDAWWRYGVEDGELVRLARAEERIVLTQDAGLMLRAPVASGEVASLFVPRDLAVAEQLALVFRTFGLARREPRCMKCGGALRAVPKESVRGEAPPRTFLWLEEFYRCARCGQLFWKGTHWGRIAGRLDRIVPEG